MLRSTPSRDDPSYSELCMLEEEKLENELRKVQWGDSISENIVRQLIPRLDFITAVSDEYLRYSRNSTLGNIALKISEESRSFADSLQMIGDCCIKLGNSRSDLDEYLRGVVGLEGNMLVQMRSRRATGNDCEYISLIQPLISNIAEISTLAKGYELCQDLTPVLDEMISFQKKLTAELRYLGRGC